MVDLQERHEDSVRIDNSINRNSLNVEQIKQNDAMAPVFTKFQIFFRGKI